MTTPRPWPQMRRNLIAILRGITFDEVAPVTETLIDAGFEAIEVPLNSPDPFRSIGRAVETAGDRALIGAGTVLTPDDVGRLVDTGGRLLVSPNVDPAVLDAAVASGLITMPGVMTPTEAFTALAHGASALKFFPAGILGADGIAAVRAVLPTGTMIGAVGGVSEQNFAAYATAGVRAFGLGSSLYRPGMEVSEVATRARAAVAGWDATFENVQRAFGPY